MCAVIYIIYYFYIRNEYFYTFFLQNVSKIFSKTYQITSFLQIFSGEHAPNPPTKRVAPPHAAWRFAPTKYPHFHKNILNHPRNDILDTPPPPPHGLRYSSFTYSHFHIFTYSHIHLSHITFS